MKMGQWKMLRIALFMMKKGVLKRRYLRQELTNKANVFGRNLRKMMFSKSSGAMRLGQREYEFSCSNSPAFAAHSRNYLACLQPNTESPTCTALSHLDSNKEEDYRDTSSVGICDYCDVEEVKSEDVDREAEEFIASFYNQMKLQRQISLLQYEEMLARGAN